MIISPALRRSLTKCARIWATQQAEDRLAFKARVRARIDQCAENGIVALCHSSRDCDGVHAAEVDHVPAPGVMAFLRLVDRRQEAAEGPDTTVIRRPSTNPPMRETWGGWDR